MIQECHRDGVLSTTLSKHQKEYTKQKQVISN
jgi:hypothetical protein